MIEDDELGAAPLDSALPHPQVDVAAAPEAQASHTLTAAVIVRTQEAIVWTEAGAPEAEAGHSLTGACNVLRGPSNCLKRWFIFKRTVCNISIYDASGPGVADTPETWEGGLG